MKIQAVFFGMIRKKIESVQKGWNMSRFFHVKKSSHSYSLVGNVSTVLLHL